MNFSDIPLYNALHEYGKFGEAFILSLIYHGADVNLTPLSLQDSCEGRPISALLYAVRYTNSLPIVDALIDKGSKIDACKALHEAVALNKPEMVKCLLKRGADPSLTMYGKTAIQMAENNPALLEILAPTQKRSRSEEDGASSDRKRLKRFK